MPGIKRQHQRIGHDGERQIEPAPETVRQCVDVELRPRIKGVFWIVANGVAGDGCAAAEQHSESKADFLEHDDIPVMIAVNRVGESMGEEEDDKCGGRGGIMSRSTNRDHGVVRP